MTKITLRKAKAVQDSINTAMSSIRITPVIELNEFEDPAECITAANAELMAADVRRSDLLMALYSLRTLVGNANAASGITARLGHAAFIERRIDQLKTLVSNDSVVGNLDVLRGRLEKSKNQPQDPYTRYNQIMTGVMGVEQSEKVRVIVQDLRKQKQTLNDEILDLNVRTEIELSDDVAAILAREGII